MSQPTRHDASAPASALAVQACGLTLAVPIGRGVMRTLVDELDWQGRIGERWCVIGRNGAGKSSLLRAWAGLPAPLCGGDVFWADRPTRQWSHAAAARWRAYQPQQVQDRFALPVRRLLELAAPGGTADLSRCAELLAALDIAHLLDRDARSLSGGERQRVALAQCALQATPLMLLDEPVSFQDPAHRQAVARWLVQGAARCTVFTAHDPNWMAGMATHVLALHGDGEWQAGPVEDLLQPAVLERVYGCPFRQVSGAWAPA